MQAGNPYSFKVNASHITRNVNSKLVVALSFCKNSETNKKIKVRKNRMKFQQMSSLSLRNKAPPTADGKKFEHILVKPGKGKRRTSIFYGATNFIGNV